jgi:hypothetical protein
MASVLPASSPEPGENLSGVERRAAPRFPSELRTECRPLMAPGAAWKAQVENISRTGLALVLSRRFEKGAVLTMDLENSRCGISRNVVARVVHARPHDEGGWLLGCVFINALDDDELKAFSAARVPAPESDCRAWVRFTCDVPTTCRPDGVPDAEPVAVRVVDIAPGGVGLVAAEAWEPGTFLLLDLPGTSRCALLRVVRSAVYGGEWFFGCEFTDRVKDQDLHGLLQ